MDTGALTSFFEGERENDDEECLSFAVCRLREHWEETRTRVEGRKAHLEGEKEGGGFEGQQLGFKYPPFFARWSWKRCCRGLREKALELSR